MQALAEDEKRAFGQQMSEFAKKMGVFVSPGFSSWFDGGAKTLFVAKDAGPYVIPHEAFHVWLYVRKGFYDPLGMAVGKNGQASEEDRQVSISVVNVTLREEALTDGIPKRGMFPEKTISGLQAKGDKAVYDFFGQRAGSLKEDLESAFGAPTKYNGRASWLGNVVDESRTLGVEERAGHPMDNFSELFASLMASLSFAPEKVIGNIGKLPLIAHKHPEAAQAIREFLGLLGKAAAFGGEMEKEIAAASLGSGKSAELSSLRGNLAKASAAISGATGKLGNPFIE